MKNKELTPLEALEIINHCTNLNMPNEMNGYQNELYLIETALKDYVQIKPIIDALDEGKLVLFNEEQYKQIQKENKALWIIKNKEVDVFIFLHSGDLETYNDKVEYNRKLIKKEYDLLKEVLK